MKITGIILILLLTACNAYESAEDGRDPYLDSGEVVRFTDTYYDENSGDGALDGALLYFTDKYGNVHTDKMKAHSAFNKLARWLDIGKCYVYPTDMTRYQEVRCE